MTSKPDKSGIKVTINVPYKTYDYGLVTLSYDDPKYWAAIIGTLGDVDHNGQDTWSDEEWEVIQTFLTDVTREANVQYQEELT